MKTKLTEQEKDALIFVLVQIELGRQVSIQSSTASAILKKLAAAGILTLLMTLTACGGGGTVIKTPPPPPVVVVFDQTPPKSGQFCQPFFYQFAAHGDAGITFVTIDGARILGLPMDTSGYLSGTPEPPSGLTCNDGFTLTVTPDGSPKVQLRRAK